jgi:hypothetical protein
MKKESVSCFASCGFLSVLFFLSAITLTVLLSVRPMPALFYIVEILLCSAVWGWVAFKYRIMEHVRRNNHKVSVWLSILLAVAFIPAHYQSLNFLLLKFERENTPFPADYEPYVSFFFSHKALLLTPVLLFASLSLCFIFICLSERLRRPVVDFFKHLAPFERLFLTVGSLVCAVITVLVFTLTNVFYLPAAADDAVILFDVIYTTDTGATLLRDCYVNPAAPENDLRQPLFGIFALPFGLLAKCISYALPVAQAYPLIMNIVQIILLLIAFILLSRMLDAGRRTRIYFLLLTVSTFPFMLFALNMEQYVFAFFWTILLIYHSYRTRAIGTLLPVAAAGSILTSAVLVPPLLFMNREADFVKKCAKMLFLFLALFVCGGMIDVIHKFRESVANYGTFTDADGGFAGKWQQFTHFITSCFVAPPSQVVSGGGAHVSYQLTANPSNSLAGILLLGLAIVSGILFRRRYIAKISLYWLGFAFALLCLFGWGTAEGGIVLYSLYIFWAFVVLLMLLMDKLLPEKGWIAHAVYGLLCLALLIYNARQMFDMVSFGITYYPVS